MDMLELWTALFSGRHDIVEAMVDRGVNVNASRKTEFGVISLLHYAVTKSDVQNIRLLANLGANLNVRDSKNRTPLHWVGLFHDKPDIVEALIYKGAMVNVRDHNQMTPLHHAAANNCIESAEKLIASGADIDATGVLDLSVLHVAVMSHKLEMVKVLISHGVNLNSQDIHGCTPLLRYLRTLRMEGLFKTPIVELLVENGADVNSKSRNTQFPLLLAAKFNRLTLLHLLLKSGARVNEATNKGKTALHMACMMGYEGVVAILLKFGADLNVRNQKGKTPFELLRNCSPSHEATAQIIIREAVKREALGQFLCEEYTRMVKSCRAYTQFARECCEEVKRMQSEKIDVEDSAISFFYILSVDEENLAALARNETIVTAFESSGYVASFRIYAGELTTKFEVAKKRANLPALVVRKIRAYVKYGYIIENKMMISIEEIK